MIIMDDSGVDSINLKAFMQQGKATLLMAEQIGSAIGEFIGGMHKWGRGNTEVLDSVRGNEQAKVISAWFYYGRLVSTLKGLEDDGSPIPKLSSPSLEIERSDMEVVEKVVEETTKATLDVKDSVCHSKLPWKKYFYLEYIVCNGRFLAWEYHGISQQERRLGTPLYP